MFFNYYTYTYHSAAVFDVIFCCVTIQFLNLFCSHFHFVLHPNAVTSYTDSIFPSASWKFDVILEQQGESLEVVLWLCVQTESAQRGKSALSALSTPPKSLSHPVRSCF